MSSGPKSANIRPEEWFERGHLMDNMKERSVKGGLRTVGAQLFSFSTNLLTTIFLARLLLPEDYGIVAMVTSFTGFILIFKDLGIAQAVISQDGLTQRLVSELFWFNVLISIVLALLIAGTAPLVVWFYGESRLAPITFAYAGIAILGGYPCSIRHCLAGRCSFSGFHRSRCKRHFSACCPHSLWPT
nr:oligosaccharide flippase family protein [Nitritalea halalkaliphila]